jgi:hypothetical protein
MLPAPQESTLRPFALPAEARPKCLSSPKQIVLFIAAIVSPECAKTAKLRQPTERERLAFALLLAKEEPNRSSRYNNQFICLFGAAQA